MIVNCEQCGASIEKTVGHINRALKSGCKLFCNKKCFGLSRRLNLSIEQKKQIKSEYDKEFRIKNKDRLKKIKAEYHKKNYDPVKAAIYRKSRMPYHVEYCRQPKYKKWKQQYDEVYTAKKNYGEYYESAIALKNILSQIDNRETKQLQGLSNKTQKRKRAWKTQQNQNYRLQP